MAMPAAQPLQKRYTAGSCTLEVDLQPSALSQWYPQPVVKDMRFRLQMQDANNGDAPMLIAQGDRAALLEISQYISHRVRRRLTAVHSRIQSNGLPLNSKEPAPEPPIPESFQITGPLGYSALCDLNVVLQQCEQQSAILPVALPALSTEDKTDTPTVTAVNDSSKPSSIRPSNVISLSEARRRVRRRSMVWASSAAAALLAVGLTTSLWTRPESSSELSVTADADAELPNESVESGDTAQRRLEQKAARPRSARNGEAGSPPPTTSGRTPDRLGQGSATPDVASTPKNSSRDTSRDIGNVATAPVTPSTGRSLPAAVPPASEGASVPELKGSIQSEAARPEAAQPQPVPLEFPPSEPAPEELAAEFPERVGSEADAESSEKITAAARPGTLDEQVNAQADIPEVIAAQTLPPPPPAQPAPGAAAPPIFEESESVDLRVNDVETFSTGERLPERVNRSRVGSVGDDSAADQALAQPEKATIDQVQLYFQTQWNESEAEISEPLSYELQLSEAGEVKSFASLNGSAQAYRDRLLPGDMAPTFLGTGQGLTLRIDIVTGGQVSVSTVER